MLAQNDQWEEFMIIEKDLRDSSEVNDGWVERFYSSALTTGKSGPVGCQEAVKVYIYI